MAACVTGVVAAAGTSLTVSVPPLHPAAAMTVMAAALAAPAMGLFIAAASLSRWGLAWERTGRWTGSSPRPSSRSSSPGHWWTCRARRRRGCRCTAAPSRRWGCSRRTGSRWQSCTGSRSRRRRRPRGSPPAGAADGAAGPARRPGRRAGRRRAGRWRAGRRRRCPRDGLGHGRPGFHGLDRGRTGFAVTVLETVGLGSGARTTVVVAVPHAVTAAATMATAPAAPAIGILMIALPRQPHHPLPYQLKPAIPANRPDDTGTDTTKIAFSQLNPLRPGHPPHAPSRSEIQVPILGGANGPFGMIMTLNFCPAAPRCH